MRKFLMPFALVVLVSSAFGDDPQVPRWQPHDFEFRSTKTFANPFKVDFIGYIHRTTVSKIHAQGVSQFYLPINPKTI